jgi:hypothetical protein
VLLEVLYPDCEAVKRAHYVRFNRAAQGALLRGDAVPSTVLHRLCGTETTIAAFSREGRPLVVGDTRPTLVIFLAHSSLTSIALDTPSMWHTFRPRSILVLITLISPCSQTRLIPVSLHTACQVAAGSWT